MPERSKVFWSNAERSTIVRLAVDLMCATPTLTGLPLLRAGIEALPIDRQRKVIALSQAPWFVGMVQDEMRRRELEADVILGAGAVRPARRIIRSSGWGRARLPSRSSSTFSPQGNPGASGGRHRDP